VQQTNGTVQALNARIEVECQRIDAQEARLRARNARIAELEALLAAEHNGAHYFEDSDEESDEEDSVLEASVAASTIETNEPRKTATKIFGKSESTSENERFGDDGDWSNLELCRERRG